MLETQTQTKTKTKLKVGLAIAGGVMLAAVAAGGIYIKQNGGYIRYADGLPPAPLTADTIIPIEVEGTIKSLFLSGKVKFNGDNSLIRAVLTDSDNKEYLVYETYPLMVDKTDFSVDKACDETCVLPEIKPKELKIQIINAEFDISNTVYYARPGILSRDKRTPEQARQDSVNKKIDALNKEIKANDMDWVAGETSVSLLTYTEKKRLFASPDGKIPDKVPNLQGFEYYKGGVFEYRTDEKFSDKGRASNKPFIGNVVDQFKKLIFISFNKLASAAVTNSSDLPDKWDWRNVHGENWLTPVRNQGFIGSCWVFAKIGAIEAQINVYYNQHINPDLSEQMLLDCDAGVNPRAIGAQSLMAGIGNGCEGMEKCMMTDFCKAKRFGIPNEASDPYVARKAEYGACTYDNIKYEWWNTTWKIGDFKRYLLGSDESNSPCSSVKREVLITEGELKNILITKGPLASGVNSWNHAMVLMGYENSSSGTIWIFKNSWGPNSGENGYAKIKTAFSDLDYSNVLPLDPFTPPPGQSYQIQCVDKDFDGYCNWGISENKPSTCAASCKPEKDYDDSNPNINIKPTPNPTSTITVLSPNGREKWAPGSTQTITWKSSNVAQVGLDLTLIDGTPVVMNLVNVQGNPGTATWTIPNYIPYKQYKLRVSGCSDVYSAGSGSCSANSFIFDVSDAPFTIAPELEKYYKYNYYGTYPSYVPPLPGGAKKCSCDTSASSFDCVTGTLASTCNRNPGIRYDQCTFTSVNSLEKNNSFCYDQSGKNYFIFMKTGTGTR